MNAFKWVLIVAGALFLVLVAVIIGWLSTIETVKLTVADFEVGGTYPAEERRAVFYACKNSFEAEGADEVACTCVADNAKTQLSRFERLALVAIFLASTNRMMALGMGAETSGVSKEKLNELRAYSKQRRRTLLESCGLE